MSGVSPHISTGCVWKTVKHFRRLLGISLVLQRSRLVSSIIGICTFKPRPGVGMDCMQATTSHPAGFRPTNKSSDRCSSFCLPTLTPSSVRPCRDLTTPQMGIATTVMRPATSASNLCYRTRLPCNPRDPVSTTMLTNLSPATPSKIRRSIPSHLPTNASNNASVFSSSCRASSPSYYPSQHWSHYQ